MSRGACDALLLLSLTRVKSLGWYTANSREFECQALGEGAELEQEGRWGTRDHWGALLISACAASEIQQVTSSTSCGTFAFHHKDIPSVRIFKKRRYKLTLSRMDMDIIYAGNEDFHYWAFPYHWFHIRPLASPTTSSSLSSPITEVRLVITLVFFKVFTFVKHKIVECLIRYWYNFLCPANRQFVFVKTCCGPPSCLRAERESRSTAPQQCDNDRFDNGLFYHRSVL